MPLTPGTVTIASRIMLPTYVIFSAWLGAAWTFQDDARTAVPALATLKDVWPIWGSGIVLLTLSATVLVGILSHRRIIAAIALGAGVVVFVILSGFITVAMLTTPDASWSAPAWTLFVATAHLASLASLASDETTTNRVNGRTA